MVASLFVKYMNKYRLPPKIRNYLVGVVGAFKSQCRRKPSYLIIAILCALNW